MSNIEKLKPEESGASQNGKVRTWLDDINGQPEPDGIGSFGESAISEESRTAETMRNNVG
ncbi:hypothetical protein K5M41_24280 [Serratia marcescens]|uniref:hypothetical protein n=1 Tax=Enterobacterales TaxID=91347 RepID=UPI00052DD4B8|nr:MULTISPECIES: hypothetical protein [Enterobacterales]EKS9222285.1 hypothetical protein [Citrobacter freundii]HDR2892074.1 hypothetical protein [Enterobacter asburiae]KGM72723.1 hypothetical protein EL78_3291 [Escherichia coli]MBX9282844.1 hypothetical protein [Serratia marcescens]MBX9285653.1 hypothetical protein [Serratia marcescens]